MSLIKVYDINQYNVTQFKRYTLNINCIKNFIVFEIDENFIGYMPKKIVLYYDNRTALYDKKKKYNKKYYYTRLLIAHKNNFSNTKEMSFSVENLLNSNSFELNVQSEILKYLSYIVKYKKCPCCDLVI
jgi:hypothetical protein